MDTIDRILFLQEQSPITGEKLESEIGLPAGSISNWKKRKCLPDINAIISLAKYFHVTSDYLLCLSDRPTGLGIENSLSEEEALLVDSYRTVGVQGRFWIITACTTQKTLTEKNKTM